MMAFFRLLVLVGVVGVWGRPAAAQAGPHVATGLSLELVAAEAAVVPGRPLSLGLVLRPDAGFHTYWRQPGVVGLTPTVEWSLPPDFAVGEMLWPEPERGMMAAYGVWCFKREVSLVAPVAVSAGLDPAATPEVTFKARVVWMACSRTCHPGTAELVLTLPVKTEAEAEAEAPAVEAPAAALIARTRREQAVVDEAWNFSAVRHGPAGGWALTVTPPAGRQVPEDAYFFSYQRLIDSNVEPVRRSLPGGAVRLELALVEEPDATPETLEGELWSAGGWGGEGGSRLLRVRTPLVILPSAE